jgi:histidine triad (HIT) family protein
VSPEVRGCKFCAIEAGAAPAQVVLEGESTLAFLDHRPVFPGHTLLIPRRHIETLPELPDELLGPLFADARRIAAAMEGGFGAHGTFLAINNRISQSVPHLHVHVVPRHRRDGLRGFFWPRTRYADDAEATDVADRVRAAIDAVGHPETG